MEFLIYFVLAVVAFKAVKSLTMAGRYREWTPVEDDLAKIGVGGVEGYLHTQERKKQYLMKQLQTGEFFQRPWNERDRELFVEAYRMRARLLGVSEDEIPEIVTRAGDFYDQHTQRGS